MLEKKILDLFSYDEYTTILHTDQSLLPSKKYRRNFNYTKLGNNYVLTGIISRIQNVSNPNKHDDSVILTNIPSEVDINELKIDKNKILHIKNWYHISQTRNLMILIYLKIYKKLEKNNVKFTGSWTSTIGHSRSYLKGIDVATSLLIERKNINVHKVILNSTINFCSISWILLRKKITSFQKY